MWKAIFTKITTDGHLPIGLFIFIVGSAIHIFHGLDASFVAFTSTVLTFLGAHAIWGQKDQPTQ